MRRGGGEGREERVERSWERERRTVQEGEMKIRSLRGDILYLSTTEINGPRDCKLPSLR